MATATIEAQNDPRAHKALRAGHDSGYRFPEGFYGFSGAVSALACMPDGATTEAAGSVIVGGPGAISVDGFPTGDLSEWVGGELRSMAGHRWSTPYDEADGKHTLSLDDTTENPLGDYIKVHNDRFDSAYRVRDGKISQVVRSMGPVTFTITIQEHQTAPDGRTLPAHFTVSFWKDGRLDHVDMYQDEYREVDGVWVPGSRRVITVSDDGFTTRQLEVDDVSLLTEPVATGDAGSEREGRRQG